MEAEERALFEQAQAGDDDDDDAVDARWGIVQRYEGYIVKYVNNGLFLKAPIAKRNQIYALADIWTRKAINRCNEASRVSKRPCLLLTRWVSSHAS